MNDPKREGMPEEPEELKYWRGQLKLSPWEVKAIAYLDKLRTYTEAQAAELERVKKELACFEHLNAIQADNVRKYRDERDAAERREHAVFERTLGRCSEFIKAVGDDWNEAGEMQKFYACKYLLGHITALQPEQPEQRTEGEGEKR